MFAIIKKELKQYFYSMVGFVFLAFFLAIVGLYTWAGNSSQGIGNFEMTLGNMTFIFNPDIDNAYCCGRKETKDGSVIIYITDFFN